MNEDFRRRLIGLTVLLVLMFGLSFLLPKDTDKASVDGLPSTTVNLDGTSAESTKAEPSVESEQAPIPPVQPIDPPKDLPAVTTNPEPSVDRPAAPAQTAPLSSKQKSEPAPKPQPAPLLPKPKPSELVAASPAMAAGWYVQIGSYSDQGNATTILRLLRNVGYKGEISKIVNGNGVTLYRVRLGVFATEAAAKQVQEKVARQGYRNARVASEGNVQR